MDNSVSPLRAHQQHLRPFDVSPHSGGGSPLGRSPRTSEDGSFVERERVAESPVELMQSRENSVHGPSGSLGGAMHAMSPDMQLALYPLFFVEDRHEASDVCRSAGAKLGKGGGIASDTSDQFRIDNEHDDAENNQQAVSRWRMKDRMKTMSVALIMCLNIGVDPPDVLKISPCARLECWINPLTLPPAKALEMIGKALQAQYERWQPRARYKLQLDPTVEDVKKLCLSCRRNAKNERVLVHYNGHGVPKPTANGEVWVFNKTYTQYIPLSVFDLQQWCGNPAIYVFDCGGAGVVVDAFLQLAQAGGLGGRGGIAPGGNASGGVGKLGGVGSVGSTTQNPQPQTLNDGGPAPGRVGAVAGGSGGPGGAGFVGPGGVGPHGANERNRVGTTGIGGVDAKFGALGVTTGGHATAGQGPGVNTSGHMPGGVHTTSVDAFGVNAPVGTVPGAGQTQAPISPLAAAASLSNPIDATMGGAMPLGAGMSEVILLAACGADETLPQSAELPADVFSACLTTPIKIALQWFCARSILKHDGVNASLIDQIPGQQNNRKTPLGELNWIFTAVTDTIAWNALPRPLFQRLFRQDLLVASLFRNFLLAERVMRASNCTPVSCPAMPPTYQHPMWHAWDAAVEICLLQMPGLLNAGDDGTGDGDGGSHVEFTPSPFFTEQLTAFEVWLERGSFAKSPPEQLPIVLQVLLSQSHRLRALVLLGRFLDMGPWAVDLALSVGIFPYVLKLLQTTAPDLRQILVFIWTKILALDASCQADLVKDGGHTYFARFLDAQNTPSEERAMAAFVLAAVCDGHEKGQNACADAGVLRICLHLLPGAASREHGSPLLVRWLCLLMGKLWENVLATTKEAFGCGAPDAVASLLQHPTPDARAAAVYALGALVFVSEDGDDQDVSHDEPGRRGGFGASASTAHGTDDGDKNTNAQFTFGDAERAAAERAVACHILPGVADASPVVRAETAIALGRLACAHSKRFRAAAEWYAALHMSPDYRNNRNNPNTLERRGSREFGGREGTAVMRALDEEGSLSFERGGAAGSAGNGGNGNAGTGPPLPVPHHKRSSPTSPTRDRRAHHNMAAFGSSTSLASLGSTGSLGGLAGSAGRNAGVYAATDAGPFEPAFGAGPEYRDPAVPSDFDENRFRGDDHLGDPDVVNGIPGDDIPGGTGIPGSAPGETYASADAARVGGGLYWHLLERLAELARDPSPRVAVCAQRALLATGLDPNHPLLKPVVGKEALRSLRVAKEEGGSGDAGDDEDQTPTTSPSQTPAATTQPFGHKGRTASWHHKLSAAAARILGSPGRKQRTDLSSGGSSSGSLSEEAVLARGNQPRRSGSGARLASPLAGGNGNANAMKRVATDGTAPLRRMMPSVGDHETSSSPSLVSMETSDGVRGVGAISHTHGPWSEENSPRASDGANRVSPFEERNGGESNARNAPRFSAPSPTTHPSNTHTRRVRAMPASQAFTRAREHFGRSLLEPPNGQQGYENGYDDDDETFGIGAQAPAHRRLDPDKRLARRRVFENRSRQASRAVRAQLTLPACIGTLDSFSKNAVPSAVVCHPLTPTLVCGDTNGKVTVWDYQQNRTLHHFDAGMPGRTIAGCGLINDLDDAVLWTSGMDGSVRVWRNYACPGEESLVAAVRALPLPALSACVDRQTNLNRGLDRVGLKQNASTGGGGGTGAPKPPLGSRGGLKETVWLAAGGAAGDATDGRGGFRVDSQDASRGLRMDATDSRGPIDRDCSSRSYHDFNQHYGHPRKPRVRPAVVWQQQSGCLYASGDTYPVPLLRVWDMTRELCLESLQTQSPGTCLTAQGALLMAGALDGAVMSFDLRTPARLLSVVQTHADRVVAILLQPGNVGNLVVTGSANGEMKFCDLRNSGKPFHNANAFGLRGGGLGGAAAGGERGVGGDEWGRRSSGGSRDQGSTTFAGPPSGGGRASYSGTGTPAQSRATNAPTSGQTTHENNKALTGLVAHSNARLIACASTERVVRLWDLEGNPTAVVKQRAAKGEPTCLHFHPNQISLAVGSSDGAANVYSGEVR